MKFKVEITARGTVKNTISFEADSVDAARKHAMAETVPFRQGVQTNLRGCSTSLAYEHRLFQITETIKEI